MGIKIVRTPSETPNITNVDDIIPFRYAYGNQNGYVIGRGSQLDGSYESGEFTIGSGRAVIQGVEIDIDANGISTTLDTASETRYFKIYLKVNLANDVVVLESYYSTVSYDEITDPTSSDLISGGDAYLLLYTLQLRGTTQAEKNKVVKEIEYYKDITAKNSEKIQNIDLSASNKAQFGDYIVSKKKLLWSGSVYIQNNTKITNLDLSNKTIEVVENNSGNKHFYKFSVYVYNNVSRIQYVTDVSFGIGTISVHKIEFKKMSDGLYGSAWRTRYDISSSAQEIIDMGSNITEIYEIIE